MRVKSLLSFIILLCYVASFLTYFISFSYYPPRRVNPNEQKFRHDQSVLSAFQAKYGDGLASGYDSYHESNGAQSPLSNSALNGGGAQWRIKENSKERISANPDAHLCRHKIMKNLEKYGIDHNPRSVQQTYATVLATFLVSLKQIFTLFGPQYTKVNNNYGRGCL